MFGHIYKILFGFSIILLGSTPWAQSGTISKIRTRGELRVAMVQNDHIPYVFTKNGQLTGIDINLAKKLAHHLGVKLTLIRTAMRYDDVVDQVASGLADIAISNLSISLERALKICYSKPYIHLSKAVLMQQAYFAKHRKTDDTSLVEFFSGNNRLGVVRGSAYVEFSREAFPKARIVLYDHWENLVRDVKNGKIAGAFWDQFEVAKVIFTEPHGLLTYMVVHLDMPQDKVAMAMPKNDPHLWHWVNTFMEIEVSAITGRQLARRYLKDKGLQYETR